MLNLGMNLQRLAAKQVEFTPASLFNNGEAGVWYDPSDITTLYQDSLGVTPVTAVGEPVGLMLDKSKGLAQGPELITNGDFATDSGWSKGTGWTISGGQAVGASANSNLAQSISVSNGSLYKAKFTISSYTSGSINRVQLGRRSGLNVKCFSSW